VQEQWRANGALPFFQTGIQRQAGACTVWTGIYAYGTRWLAYTDGNVSLLASSNAFSQARPARYARTHICRKQQPSSWP
jgi:hypothetical protein